MAAYPKPTNNTGTFNNQSFVNPDTGGLTIDEAKKYFVTFPNTQSPSTIIANNFNTTGSLNVAGDSQFGGDVTFIGGVSIAGGITFEDDVEVAGTTTLDDNLLCLTTATVTELLTCEGGIDITTIGDGITFPDNTTQTTAFIEANYAQLNTDNTFLAPYKQTFQQNNSTVPSTASLQINNIDNSDNVAFYIDPTAGNDLTLYSSQSNGGLTVRNPNASFTLNPVIISTGIVGAQSVNPIDMNGYSLYGVSDIYYNGSTLAPIMSLSNTGVNIGSFKLTAGVVTSGQLNGTSVNLSSTVGGSGINYTYYNSGIASMNILGTDTLAVQSLGTDVATFNGTGGINFYKNLGMNNSAIVNTSNIQVGGLTSGTYTNLTQSGSTLGINNTYPASSSPQISLAVYNSGGALTGLTIASNGASLGIPLSLGGYNITNVGNIGGYLGAPVTTATPTSNIVPTAIATTQYVETAIASIPAANVPFIYGTTASISWNQVTTGYFNGNYAPNNNGSYDQVQGGFASISFTVPKDPTVYPVVVNANMQGNITYPTGGTSLNSATGPYQPFSGGSTPYGWNGLQMLWGYGCSVNAPILTGGYGVTVSAQTFFSSHLNTNSNIGVNNNPFTTVSFMVYQS